MTNDPVLIRKIDQKDNFTFSITWSDGRQSDYRLSELQKRCPCAACVDEYTGKRLLDESSIRSDVRAERILSIGRYALRIQFTSGCSSGIYDLAMLRKLSIGSL